MLCDACRAESDAWLDTRPSEVYPNVGITSGAAYDDTATGAAERNSGRWKAWRDLIRSQRELIRAGCAAGRHAAARTQPRDLETVDPGRYL